MLGIFALVLFLLLFEDSSSFSLIRQKFPMQKIAERLISC